MLTKRHWGYVILIVYTLLHFDLFFLNRVEPIIFGLPYAMWSKIIYGVLVVPLLYLVYRWIWTDISEDEF